MLLSIYKIYCFHFSQCFYDNQMKANSGKCDFICSINDKVNVIIENQKNSNNKKQQSMQKAVTA